MTQFQRILILLFTMTLAFAQDPEALLELGESQLLSGDIIGAEKSLKDAVQADPSFAPAIQTLSKLYLHKGDLKKANEFSNQAVQADEDFREWAIQIGKITEHIQNGNRNVQQGLYEEAIIEYDAILKAHPYFPDGEFYKGLTRFRQKDIEGAARHFSNALKIYPLHPKARKGLDNVTKQFLNKGNKSYKRGNLAKAKDYYYKALEFDTEFYLAYFQLGVLEKKQGNSKKAIELLQKVLEIKPEHDKTWFTLGTAYESDGNTTEAVNHYLQAIEFNQGYSKAYGNLGKLYTESKDYKLAEDVLKTVIQIDPNYADGFMRLGFLYIELEKYDLAVENLAISTSLDDEDYNKYFNLASAYNHLKKWNEAATAAQSCVDLKRKFGGGWLELGIAELGKRNRTRAKKHFQQAKNDRNWREMAERKIDEINNPEKYEK
ncbi:MAG: tetratricopeptide repeat protein [Candidatus Marinimicrobia bacterium]|jgi:tetratricopeptide (TPR) repeat protein|nr:tetratricopeptide repeat protein [Candidatus Neomarinimicrobiota bacterium]MBT3502279.1 tetratricopeptide repeat protein [Candidatus Neomarinimicrobiota bacterium]MBT3840357.1 tetratricopeptide repeat protein [Candidatus Neomarinimicrobiota bacterium]MBT3998523.1 tetratricopeptide repeat protein [Candidatus Neomarinimicrobiota bacterium]MBT4578985.1 tetratricopeptide repeat protein [Candidatus Neomarinimicrobiota bacterium]